MQTKPKSTPPLPPKVFSQYEQPGNQLDISARGH